MLPIFERAHDLYRQFQRILNCGMEPSERKLLFVFVRDALSRAGEDSIDTRRRSVQAIPEAILDALKTAQD